MEVSALQMIHQTKLGPKTKSENERKIIKIQDTKKKHIIAIGALNEAQAK